MSFTFENLYEAIEIGNFDLIKEILSADTSLLYEKDKYKFTVVHAVASTDDEEIAKFILDKEVDVNIKNDEGIAALHIALYPEITQLLINYGADVNITNNQGNTPLHIQAFDGEERVDVIEVLLDNGADKNIKNNKGEKPFDIAKKREDIDNMELLK